MDNDLAFSIADPGSIPEAIYKIPTRPSINISRIAKAPTAFSKALLFSFVPNPEITAKVPPREVITIVKDAAAANVFSTGN